MPGHLTGLTNGTYFSTGSHISRGSAMVLQDSSRESPLGFWLAEAAQMPQASHAIMHPAFVPSLRPTFRTHLASVSKARPLERVLQARPS